MTIAILATGDEIIQGDTLNTNGFTIAQILNSDGMPLGMHLACSDREQDMFDCLCFLSKNHPTIILIGGLGPTSDDRTRFALARFLNVPLVEFPEALAHVQDRLTRANLTMNEGNRQQALFPANATLLPNPHGTALGCYYATDTTLFVLLPGPPRECLPMFTDCMLPVLQKTMHRDKPLLKWRLFGIAEGTIAEILDNALAGVDCEIGYRCETPYIEFKVRCAPDEVARVMYIIEPLVAGYIIAQPEQKASDCLRLRIEQLQAPMVILDDVTGGILQTLLQRPSNYRWLTFHATSNAVFHFHLTGLEDFWQAQSGSGTTQVTINYNYKGEQGSETHQIPYYSPLVVHYAAEWLSFRLLQLIDQFH